MLGSLAADHVQTRRGVGPLAGATAFGASGQPGEGPFVEIWLRAEGERIAAAAYRTHGCPSSIAAASVLCAVVTGRTPEQAARLSPQDLILVMGGIPEGKEGFAAMAVEALGRALKGE